MTKRSGWILDSRICWLVLLAFTGLFLLQAPAEASLIPSRLASGELATAERQAQIDSIRQALEQDLVSQRLADYGLTPAEISAKLPTLSDDQLHQLASLSKSAGEGGILGEVIAVLLVILLVVVILKLMNKEIVIR